MNLNQLKYVLAVARARSFSKAAAELYITQPSLSRSIISWEEQLGVKVFDRSTNPLGLTAAGQIVIRAVESMCEIEQEMMDNLDALRHSKEIQINFGATPARARHLIRPIVQFKQVYPDVTIHINELYMAQLIQQLQKGELDFIFGAGPATDPNLDFLQVSSEQFYLIAPQTQETEGSPLPVTQQQIQDGSAAGAPCIEFMDFKDEPVIGYHQNMRLQQKILELYSDCGITPNIVAHSHNADTALNMVREGIGITIASSTALRNCTFVDQIRCYRLNTPDWPLGIFVNKNKPLSAHSQDFVHFLKHPC